LLHRSAAELLEFVLPLVRDEVAEEPTLLPVRQLLGHLGHGAVGGVHDVRERAQADLV
jgi:hypothetical protein